MSEHPINDRAQSILRAVIEQYIENGQPVASKALAGHGAVSLSPASIRTVMADLEASGLVYSPHTSAGRVPTTKGYRFFVDGLLTTHFDGLSQEQMEHYLPSSQNSQELIQSASQLLSGITRQVGIVTVPHLQRLMLRHVEFLPLSDNRVLAILVLNEQDVQNRIIHTDKAYSGQELERVANYLNDQFAGKELPTIRHEIVQLMTQTRKDIDSEMDLAINMANEVLDVEENSEDVVVAGEANLLDMANFVNLDKIRSLFDVFAEKQSLLHILDRCLQADGVQIFIGDESGHEFLGDCSLITASYKINGDVTGVLGVLGPTHMNYPQAISIVDITAKCLSSNLR